MTKLFPQRFRRAEVAPFQGILPFGRLLGQRQGSAQRELVEIGSQKLIVIEGPGNSGFDERSETRSLLFLNTR